MKVILFYLWVVAVRCSPRLFQQIEIDHLTSQAIMYNDSNITQEDIGEYLQHSFGNWNKVDLQLQLKDINKEAKCDPNLGVLYKINGKWDFDSPLALYYTPYGQIAGLNLKLYNLSEGLNTLYMNEFDELTISFRNTSVICSNMFLDEKIGNQVVLNQGGNHSLKIPLIVEEAFQARFQPGACKLNMGQHWVYDMQMAPEMSWEITNQLPLMPLYHTTGSNKGKFTGFLIFTDKQQSCKIGVWDNQWFGCMASEDIICTIWCNSQCFGKLSKSSIYSPYHFLFYENLKEIVCENPPKWWQEQGIKYAAQGDCPSEGLYMTPNPTYYQNEKFNWVRAAMYSVIFVFLMFGLYNLFSPWQSKTYYVYY